MMNDRRRITQSGGHNANRITGGIKRQLDLVYPTTTTLSPGTTTTNMNNTSTTTMIPQQQQQQQSHKNNNNNGHSFQQPRPTFPLSNNNYTNNQQRATSFRSVNPQSSSSIYQNTYNNNTTNTNNNMEKKPFRCVPVPNQTPVTTTRTTTNFPNNNNSNTTTNTNTNNNSNNNNNTNNENTRRFTSVPIPSTTTTTAISHATTTNSNATTNMPRGYGSGRKAYFSATVPPSTTSSNSSSSTSPNKPLLPTSPTTATSPSTIHTNNNNNAVVTSGWNNVNRRVFVPQQTSPPNTMKTSGGGATSTTTTRGQFTMAPPPQTNYPKPTFARKNNNNASPPYSKIVSPQPQQQQQQQRSSFTTPVRTFKPVISPTSSHIQAQNQQSPTIVNHSHNTSSILISPSNNTSEFMEDSIVVNVGGANDTMEPISSFADLGFMTSGSKNESSDSNAAAAMELKRMMEKLEEERHLLRSQLLDMQKQNEMIETKYKQERQTYESKLEYSNNENERLKKQEEETRRQFHEQLILEQKRIQELEQQQQQKSSENEQYVEDMDLFDDFDLDAAQQRLNAQIAAQKEEPPVMNHRLESPLKNQQRAQAEPMEIDESTISLNNHSLSDSVILQTGRSSNLIPLMPRKDKYDETLYQLMFPLTQYSQKLFKKLFLKSSIRSIAPLVIEIMKSSIDNIHDESQIELNIALIEAAVDVLLLFFSKNRDAFDCIESMIGAQLLDGLDEPIKTEETNGVPLQAIFKNPRIKLGSAWEPSMPSISNDCLLFKSNTVIDSKVVQPIIDFSHLVTNSPKEDVDIKLNTVDLLLDFIKVLIQDDTLQLPRHVLGRATRALELTFSALRALASVDSPNIINSFKKFVTQDYLFAFPLDDMNLWKSLLHIFPPLLKHKCIVATLLDNEENVFSFLSDNLGIVREDIEEHQLLQVQHQIVQLFIFIVCNCEDGYDILLGRKQKSSSNSSSNQISSRQRDIMIANAVVLLSRQLYELENQSESSTELSKCDKLRITLIQELIKFLSIYGTEILPSTRKMVHIVKGIKVNLMERKTQEQNSYNHRTKFAFDANIISYL